MGSGSVVVEHCSNNGIREQRREKETSNKNKVIDLTRIILCVSIDEMCLGRSKY